MNDKNILMSLRIIFAVSVFMVNNIFMRTKWLFLIALAVSLLIHSSLLLFLHFPFEAPERENLKNKPVEVSLFPKEKPEEKPVVPQREEAIPIPKTSKTYPEETTLEHDLPGGRVKGVDKPKKRQKPVVAPEVLPETAEENTVKQAEPVVEEPKSNIVGDVVPLEEPETVQEPKIDKDLSGIFNTQDITDRIANSRQELPKGEDTASYNVFEQKYASYFGKFRERIYGLWEYPKGAAMRGESGVVRVTFSILKDGSVVNINRVASSGYPELDREVMRVLRNVGKIPLPSSYELDQLNVDEANFIYVIGNKYIE